MVEAQITDNTAYIFDDRSWENELRNNLFETIQIEGLLDGTKVGLATATFSIKKEFNISSNQYEERDRYVYLARIDVDSNQGTKVNRRRGVGTAILAELERRARRFGAKRIDGQISASDIQTQPWLPNFYTQNGFQLEAEGSGFKIIKQLN